MIIYSLSKLFQTQFGSFRIGNIEIHPEERRRESLSLRIGHQTECSAAAKRFVKQEIQRAKIRELERALGRKTMEVEILRAAQEIVKKSPSLRKESGR